MGYSNHRGVAYEESTYFRYMNRINRIQRISIPVLLTVLGLSSPAHAFNSQRWTKLAILGHESLDKNSAVEAEKYYLQALQEAKSKGTNSLIYRLSLGNLADALRVQDRSEAAEKLYEQQLQLSIAAGEENVQQIRAFFFVGEIKEARKPAQAEKMFEKALAISKKLNINRSYPDRTDILFRLLRVNLKQSDLTKADSIMREVHSYIQSLPEGKRLAQTVKVAKMMRDDCLGLQSPSAVAYARKEIKGLITPYVQNKAVVDKTSDLKLVLADVEEGEHPEQAQLLLRQAMQAGDAAIREKASFKLSMHFMLKYQYAEAEKQAKQTIELIEQRAGAGSRDLTEPLMTYACILQNTNRREQALSSYRRVAFILTDCGKSRTVTNYLEAARILGRDPVSKPIAIEQYNQALKLDPHGLKALVGRAYLKLELRQFASALPDLTRAITEGAKTVDLYESRAKTYLELGNPRAAVDDFETAIRQCDEPGRFFEPLAMAYLRIGDKAKAISQYTRAMALNPKDESLLISRAGLYAKAGDRAKALSDYNKAVEMKKTDANVYVARANFFIQQGEPAKAVSDFNKAIELNPRDGNLFALRAHSYLAMGNVLQSIGDWDVAITMNRRVPDYYIARGNIFASRREFTKAMIDYASALAIDSQSASALLARGNVYAYLAKFERAIADYNKALETSPRFAPLYAARGIALRQLGRNSEAEKDFSKAISLEPNNPDHRMSRAQASYVTHHYDEALRDYDIAMALKSTNPDVYAGRGLVLVQQGKYAEAQADFRKALRINPSNFNCYDGLAEVAIRYGKFQEAIENLNQALKLQPGSAPLLMKRATTYGRMKKFDKAIKDADGALKMDPTNKDLQKTRQQILIRKIN
ncbi:MAG: tetratricopeptide repeat protein [Cyanobacteria bacterium]|nr:tetratricopeptide repeat protein [Cyanobacteriota bacterium]